MPNLFLEQHLDINSSNPMRPTLNPVTQVPSLREPAEHSFAFPDRRPMVRTPSPLPPRAATHDALVVPRVAGHAITEKLPTRTKIGPDTARDICMLDTAAEMAQDFGPQLDCNGPETPGERLQQISSEALDTLNANAPEEELWRQLERVRKAIQAAVESIGSHPTQGSQYDIITDEDTDEAVAEARFLIDAMHESAPELMREMIAYSLASLCALK